LSEQNGITKVSITIFNESFDRMEMLIEGFKEGFTLTLNNLDGPSTLKLRRSKQKLFSGSLSAGAT
jgi:hypothetical protein